MTARYSILTGDLVGSSGLTAAQIDRVFATLQDTAKALNKFQQGPTRFSRHRGDGWQMVVRAPDLALRSALAMRASLRALDPGYDSYIAIACGEGPAPIKDDLNLENGPVFAASGSLLDRIKTTPLRRNLWAHATPQKHATLLLADHISQGWTQVQAQSVLTLILSPEPRTLTEIAKALGKSRQSVTRTLDAAGYDFLEGALDSLQKRDAP